MISPQSRLAWLLAALLVPTAGCRPEAAATIDRPAAEVHAALTDLARYPAWMPARFTAAELDTLEPDSALALRFDMALPGGLVPQTLVLAEHPPGQVVLRSPPGVSFPFALRWALRPDGPRTRVRLTYEYQDEQPLLSGPVRDVLRRSAAEMLSRLGAELEG